MFGIAIMTAIEEPGPDLSQIAGSDQPAAQPAGRLRVGHPAVYQYELHVAPPSAKQNTVSDDCTAFGGGAQR